MRNVGNSLDVEYVSLGIADGLPIEEFGFRRDGPAKIFRISRINKVTWMPKRLNVSAN